MKGTFEQRFWAKVNKKGPWAIINGHRSRCWLWTAALDTQGYGHFWIDGSMWRAHVVAWGFERSHVLPRGYERDHLCRRRNCIRLLHLEAVTSAVNTRRGGNALKTHCPRGHPYDLSFKMKRRGCSICLNKAKRLKRMRTPEQRRVATALLQKRIDKLIAQRKRSR